jgi:serine/threonine-protein kinase RIO1
MERDIRNFSKFFGRLGFEVEPADFLEAVGGKTIGPPPAEA